MTPSTLVTAAGPLQTATGGPLQTATGGAPVVVALTLLALLIATALSLLVAVRLYRGYRRGGGRAMLGLLVGLVLLTTAPFVLRVALTNLSTAPATTRSLVATSSQLLGLVVILAVVFDRD